MDRMDREILRAVQDGIPLLSQPFANVAQKIGISEDEVIDRLEKLRDKGVIRRFGASINHHKVGITATVMVAWKVPQNHVERVGRVMSSCKEVTHCYERRVIPEKWEYNLFTVIHGYDRGSVKDFVEKLSKTTGIKDYSMLFSIKRFKRTSTGRIT